MPSWFGSLEVSFLSEEMRLMYDKLLRKRIEILDLQNLG